METYWELLAAALKGLALLDLAELFILMHEPAPVCGLKAKDERASTLQLSWGEYETVSSFLVLYKIFFHFILVVFSVTYSVCLTLCWIYLLLPIYS